MTRWKSVVPPNPPPETRMLGICCLLSALAFAAFLIVLPWLFF